MLSLGLCVFLIKRLSRLDGLPPRQGGMTGAHVIENKQNQACKNSEGGGMKVG